MKRRKLLQSLAALPATMILGKSGEAVGVKYTTDSTKKYIVFLNATEIDIESFCRSEKSLPPGTIVHPIYSLRRVDGSSVNTMDELIRIYEVA